MKLDYKTEISKYVVKNGGHPQKKCFAPLISPYKDLGESSKATVETSTGLKFEGPLVSSEYVDSTCRMRYEVGGVPAGDEPYKVRIGNRQAPVQSESELKVGAELSIGD